MDNGQTNTGNVATTPPVRYTHMRTLWGILYLIIVLIWLGNTQKGPVHKYIPSKYFEHMLRMASFRHTFTNKTANIAAYMNVFNWCLLWRMNTFHRVIVYYLLNTWNSPSSFTKCLLKTIFLLVHCHIAWAMTMRYKLNMDSTKTKFSIKHTILAAIVFRY